MQSALTIVPKSDRDRGRDQSEAKQEKHGDDLQCQIGNIGKNPERRSSRDPDNESKIQQHQPKAAACHQNIVRFKRFMPQRRQVKIYREFYAFVEGVEFRTTPQGSISWAARFSRDGLTKCSL
jgi:hypothetical protein